MTTKQQRYDAKMKEQGYKRMQLWVKKEHEQKIKDYAEKCAGETAGNDDSTKNGGSVRGIERQDENNTTRKRRPWATSKKIFP